MYNVLRFHKKSDSTNYALYSMLLAQQKIIMSQIRVNRYSFTEVDIVYK